MNKMRVLAIYNRIKCTINIIVFGHLSCWGNRDKRRKVRHKATARFIPEYFKMYLPANDFAQSSVVVDDDTEKIYSVWLQGEDNAPPLVKACFNSIRKHCSKPLVVVDSNNLDQYVQLPRYILEKRAKGNIGNAHFADIIRVELLYKYGGYWLDATCYVTEDIPKWVIKEDFFMFLAGERVGSPYSFTQNCFIRSRKGAYLLEAWRDMIHRFWRYERSNYDYFMHQFLFKTLVKNHPKAMEKFALMPHIDQDPTHALWYDYRNHPYNDDLFVALTKDSFFQKTTYRGDKYVDGSFADVMVKKML